MQVDPIKPNLKAPGTKRLKLQFDALLSNSGLKFNLRRYAKRGVEAFAEAMLVIPKTLAENSGYDAQAGERSCVIKCSKPPYAPFTPHCSKCSNRPTHHLRFTVINAQTPLRTIYASP